MSDHATRAHAKGAVSGLMATAVALAVIAAVGGVLWMGARDDAAPEPVAAVAPAETAAASTPAADAVSASAPVSPAARAFVEFARAEPPQELPLDHGYTAEGLRRLAAAVAIAGDGTLWRDRAQRLEAAAAELEKDAASLQHADVAREVFVEAAGWLEAAEARTAAEALSASEPLRTQREHVTRYFQKIAARLERGNA